MVGWFRPWSGRVKCDGRSGSRGEEWVISGLGSMGSQENSLLCFPMMEEVGAHYIDPGYFLRGCMYLRVDFNASGLCARISKGCAQPLGYDVPVLARFESFTLDGRNFPRACCQWDWLLSVASPPLKRLSACQTDRQTDILACSEYVSSETKSLFV